ncbi:hypothetical protein PENNAL_c0010G02189 [Penicillium nalgiovense]|uniref:Uncharacterized protein n=1 Tax=Penicillium nalgiovense TaxID=60175 RepID=A0A1V6YUM7_PENNA|nr:hypothetical protein PENNAL_c0010G02189 [Penicillium nalgiovense]
MASTHHTPGQHPDALKPDHAQPVCLLPRTKQPESPCISNVEPHVQGRENRVSLLEELRTICSNPDPYRAIEGLHRLIRDGTETTSTFHRKHYSNLAHTNHTSADEVDRYAMRDALQWWRHWHRSLKDHYWKLLYVAFSIIPEDVTVPPRNLLSGDFRLLGHSVAEMLNGLREENVRPQIIAFMEMCLLRQYIVQYLDKQDATVALLTANHKESIGIIDTAVNMTSLMNILSMDLPSSPLSSRSASSGLHFVPTMDAYRERVKHIRFPMSGSLRRMVDSYAKL